MQMRTDRRSLRSQAALRSALIELLEHRDYDAITVQDIVDKANVGRSTFYAHCSGKDDLLRLSVRLLRAELVAARDAAQGPGDAAGRVFGFSLPVLEHVFSHRRLYPAIAHGRAREVFMSELRSTVSELVRAELPVAPGRGDLPPEATVEYFVGAFMAMLGWWIEHKARHPAAALDGAFQDLARRGLGPCRLGRSG
jgi:AcrR family transcriptional regulator